MSNTVLLLDRLPARGHQPVDQDSWSEALLRDRVGPDDATAGRGCVETASSTVAPRILHKYSDSDSCALTALQSHQVGDARMRRVLDYISTNFAKEITIAELARVAALSTFHFARMFTRTIGISPHRYVSRLRLENAKIEIAAGRFPLAQIAFNARFSSQASFTRAFRRMTGMTPAEYRRHRRERSKKIPFVRATLMTRD